MEAAFDLETLRALAGEHLGARAGTVRLTPIRTGHFNTSYRVDAGPGRFVLRIAPPDDTGLLFYERRMMRQEPSLHALVRSRTSLPVPEVVAHDFSRTRLDRDYLLLAALPGTPMSELPGLTHARWGAALEQVGRCLRALHALTAPDCLGVEGYGYLGEHRPMAPEPSWGAAFPVMWNRLLDDVVASGGYTDEEARQLRALLEAHRHAFEHPVAARLLHMDIWSQNVLVDAAGNVTGILDFDRALWGDAEIEFAVLDHTGFSEPPFWRGYGQERDRSPAAEIRRQFYLLYEVQKYIPLEIWRARNPARAGEYRRRCLALASRLG